VPVLVGLVLAVIVVQAEEGMDQSLAPIRAQAHAIAAEIEGQPLPEWLRASGTGTSTSMGEVNDVHGLLQDARQHLSDGESQAAVCEALDADCGLPRSDGEVAATTESAQPRTFLVFVSRSLGDVQLRELFALGSGRSDLRILFRGVDEGESLIAFVASLRPLLEGLDPPPNVLLDPTPFRTHDILAVPSLVALGPDGSEQARVAGLASTRWLEQAIADGQRGDLGTRGPVADIREPDLLAELQRRLAALDLPGMKARALARSFEQLRFATLPVATEDRTRWVDPTLTAAADIRFPDGTLLVAAGESVNPLAQVPFTQRLVIFDAADRRQVTFARARAAEPSVLATVFLVTSLRRERGWQGLEQLMSQLERRVYLLTPELRQRFALERVPAVVDAEGLRFRVTEKAMRGPLGREANDVIVPIVEDPAEETE
jgi:conjugal transfer pilus assembly protein TraW